MTEQHKGYEDVDRRLARIEGHVSGCLLYTSDAAGVGKGHDQPEHYGIAHSTLGADEVCPNDRLAVSRLEGMQRP